MTSTIYLLFHGRYMPVLTNNCDTEKPEIAIQRSESLNFKTVLYKKAN